MTVTAFAPATVANVGVGFDVLGFAVGAAGDRVCLTRTAQAGELAIEGIDGIVSDLPADPTKNTATVALRELLRRTNFEGGLRVRLTKGIPLGSGMGGSAASAVAAVVAANALLPEPLEPMALLECALEGERAASGAAHADNAAPCLFGGLTATVSHAPLRVETVPAPTGVCVLVHPEIRVDTREARAALPTKVTLTEHVHQSMLLSGLLLGCHSGDHELIRSSMQDRLVEPRRARQIPAFDTARSVASEHGAFGFGIAGSGPSVFAWIEDQSSAERLGEALRAAFTEVGVESQSWVSPIGAPGARVV